MLTAEHCQLFDRPFFQFSQMKQYQPDDIPNIKAAYRQAWTDWRAYIQSIAQELGAPFATPHIERWCNGWQVRAHFFAYFKYINHQDSAAIFALILNRKQLLVHLDWHAYRAAHSAIPLSQYHQWLPECFQPNFAHLHLWHNRESEYDNHQNVSHYPQQTIENLLRNGHHFRIGQSISAQNLAHTDSINFAVQTIRQIQPLYEMCFQAA